MLNIKKLSTLVVLSTLSVCLLKGNLPANANQESGLYNYCMNLDRHLSDYFTPYPEKNLLVIQEVRRCEASFPGILGEALNRNEPNQAQSLPSPSEPNGAQPVSGAPDYCAADNANKVRMHCMAH